MCSPTKFYVIWDGAENSSFNENILEKYVKRLKRNYTNIT